MKRFLSIVMLVAVAAPLGAQAPNRGSLALGLGFGFNTAGVLGLEVSTRYLASDRVAVGCRLTYGFGTERACGVNVFVSDRRDWHLVAELGSSARGPTPVDGEPVWRSAWYANLGAGIEDEVENDAGGHYRDNRVHFIIGPSLLLVERERRENQTARTDWGIRPRVFNHTELLLYPVLR
jgi:hypothetical protein